MINHCNECPTKIRGMCCYLSYFDGEENFILGPCKYLNKKTRRCTIYKKRFKINKDCLNVEEMIEQGAVPKECAYVNDNSDVQPIQPYKTINNIKRNELIKQWKLKKKTSLNIG